MPLVTVRGLLGSGAPEIGRLVAEKLKVDYVDREIIAEVAARLNRHEQDVIAKETPPGSLQARIADALGRSYAVAGFEGSYLPAWEMPLEDTRYLETLKSVIRKLAQSESMVVRGRGTQFILRDYPKALHVLVVAPPQMRVKRVMQELNLDEKSARTEIVRFDNSAREFIKRYFKAEMEDPALYDVVVNTEHLSFEAAAFLVLEALRFKEAEAETGVYH